MANIDFSQAITAETRAAEERERTISGVIAERSRRLAMGFNYDFGSPRGSHHIGTTPEDIAGWDEVTKYAAALIATGAENDPIQIITESGPIQITAQEWQQVLLAAGQFRQPIFAASFVLQMMAEIPENFTDDQYWP